MGSRSASEGEIVDSESEKATTALPSAKGTSVNRKLRDALSPSPEASPASPGSYKSRSRSRSPYRAVAPARGEKRRREDDYHDERSHNDARRFKVHYEDRRGDHDGGYRGNGGGRGSHYDHRLGHDRTHQKQSKTRSRSPDYDDRLGRRRDDGDARLRGGHALNDRDSESRKSQHEQSVSEGQKASFSNSRFTKREAEQSSASRQGDTNMLSGHEKRQRYDTQYRKHGSLSATDRVRFADRDSTGRAIPPLTEKVDEQAPPPVDEALTIEERRKRRDAIKAKYKSQAAPLLVQALEHRNMASSASSQNGAATPRCEGSGETRKPPSVAVVNGRLSDSPSPSLATPLSNSRQGSPSSITISDDAELARDIGDLPSPAAGDEPSAADYDPTMDMQEDRLRHGMRRNGEDVPAAAYDETTQQRQDLLLPKFVAETVEKSPTGKETSGEDMFASDDEDMFADAAPKKTNETGAEAGKAVPVPKAKALDMSLLDNWDDHEGYYRIILGELLDGRYHVQSNLGKGMFSSVVRAMDTQTDKLVAIKVIRNNDTMMKAGMKEMEILEKLADADPEDKKHMIRLERSFTHKGHLCMVFENLSINLREVLKKFGRDVGINLKAVRSYAQQMFLGLSLLHKCNILHADLKPDNILVNEARNALKICDLGSAADASENDITPYLVSRFYRAPEIILGIPYDFAIDMWSVGCTLFELYTGKILFTGRTNNQMLRSIMECRGKFSLKMLKKAGFGAVHFDDHNLNFRSMERDKITGRDVTRLINFVKPTRDLKTRVLATAGNSGGKSLQEAELKEVNLFVDLLDRCLALNPEKRLTPAEALKHPLLQRGFGK